MSLRLKARSRQRRLSHAGLGLWFARMMLLGAWLWPSAAAACSCDHPAGSAHIAWPLDGATDLPVDTNLLVYTSHDEDSRVTPVLTRAVDGVEVPLDARRTLAVPYCGGATDLLRPTRQLLPNEEYTLSFRFESSNAAAVPETLPSRRFTTGPRTLSAEPKAELAFSYNLLLSAEDCMGRAAMPCDDLAAIGIDIEARGAKGLPIVISLSHGEYVTSEELHLDLSGSRSTTMSLPIPSSERCVQIQATDAYGREIANERLCKPAKCARLAPGSRLGRDSCGPSGIGSELWEQVDDDSCASPPRVTVNQPDSEMRFTVEGKKQGSNCAVSYWAASLTSWHLFSFAPCLAIARRRRGRAYRRAP